MNYGQRAVLAFCAGALLGVSLLELHFTWRAIVRRQTRRASARIVRTDAWGRSA